jgi:hypothetical protein
VGRRANGGWRAYRRGPAKAFSEGLSGITVYTIKGKKDDNVRGCTEDNRRRNGRTQTRADLKGPTVIFTLSAAIWYSSFVSSKIKAMEK